MSTAAILSFRLGGLDGVSIVADQWRRHLEASRFAVISVAGEGVADRHIGGLAIGADTPPRRADLVEALRDVDLVVVENVLTIPMNLPASLMVAEALRGRPAIIHHHDPPWQRSRYRHITSLPIADPAWRHVTINRLTERQFRDRGVAATTIYNGVDVDRAEGDGHEIRGRLEVGDRPLLLHPVRPVARKNVAGAIRLAEQTGGVYWLTGPAEEGYQPVLDRLLARTTAPWRREHVEEAELADAYAAADAVVFPSTWEGFGLPPLEAAVFGRPVVVGPYPVAEELRSFGFRWLRRERPDDLAAALAEPSSLAADLAVNKVIVCRHFSLDVARQAVQSLLDDMGWLPQLAG
ncbi:MAG TPA: glycosyltransferase [Acidimicrobiales bacterium]|nr:glycosyltransferase [Acidimicrobiales bacterium]